jgi:hypothetical protein
MYLYIAYTDGRTEVIQVERFSDLSTHKSGFYYYETMIDAWGKGTCIKKEDVLCVEIVSNRTGWLDDIVSKSEAKPEPLELAGEVPRPATYAIDHIFHIPEGKE